MTKTNNRFLKAAGLMMAVMMLATCVISGTMAKYTSSGSATSVKATAASWDINVGGTDIASYAFDDLHFTIDELEQGAKDGSYEDGKIVPGTFGYAEITVKNEGEVDAVLSVTKAGTTTDHQGLKFAMLDSVPTAQTASTMSDATISDAELVRTSGEKTIYIAYCWEFDDTNSNNDTTMQGQEINFGDLTLTASQAKAQ